MQALRNKASINILPLFNKHIHYLAKPVNNEKLRISEWSLIFTRAVYIIKMNPY